MLGFEDAPVVPFFRFFLGGGGGGGGGVALLKLNIGQKCALIIRGLLGGDTPQDFKPIAVDVFTLLWLPLAMYVIALVGTAAGHKLYITISTASF